MELPVSAKTSEFITKPHIKKGYYPAKLMEIKEFKKDDKWVIGNYGDYKLILDFAIFTPNEDGKPAKPVTLTKKDNQGPTAEIDVTLPKFVTFKYVKDGEERTAVTPNSDITKTFKALGWEFNPDAPLKPKDFLGKWVEVNIDDYEKKIDNETTTFSVIKDISKYKGPEVELKTNKKAEESHENSKPKNIKQELKHQDIKEKTTEQKTKEILQINEQMKNLEQLHKEGTVSKEGLDQGLEQLKKKLEELQQ